MAALILAGMVSCQTSESDRVGDTGAVLQGDGYSLTLPPGWEEVDPLRINIENAPVELIAAASGRLKGRSDFSLQQERTLTDGSSWVVVLAGADRSALGSASDWVGHFAGNTANIRTRESQALTMALAVPPSPSGIYSEYIVADGRSKRLVCLGGFSREEDAARLSGTLARMVTSLRIRSPRTLEADALGEGSNRFLR